MRACTIGLLIAAFLLFAAEAASAQTPTQQVERMAALTRPALDGTAPGGLRLGDPEAAALALFGSPDATGQSPLAERILRYELVPDLWLEVHTDPAGMRAIGVRAVGELDTLPALATWRGIHLGMPVARVLERYGEATNGRLWYTAEGIAFNLDAAPGIEVVQSILIFARGMPAP